MTRHRCGEERNRTEPELAIDHVGFLLALALVAAATSRPDEAERAERDLGPNEDA